MLCDRCLLNISTNKSHMALEGEKEQATIDNQIVCMGGRIILLEERVLIFIT